MARAAPPRTLPGHSAPLPSPCPFCHPDPSRVVLRLPTWFDATDEERAALFGAIAPVCELIKNRYEADGFNFGINSGAVATLLPLPILYFMVSKAV